jgi:hypothetical protein
MRFGIGGLNEDGKDSTGKRLGIWKKTSSLVAKLTFLYFLGAYSVFDEYEQGRT